MRRVLHATLFFLGLLGIWQLLVTLELWNPILLPSPLRVAEWIVKHPVEGPTGAWGPAALLTMRRLAIGYSIGLAAGLPLGFLTARSRTASDTLGVLALGLQTLPSVCWAIPAMMWFGETEGAMLFVVLMGTVWSILLATEHGVRSVPPIYVRAARTMGSGRFHVLAWVVLPASLPFVLSGMKQGWAFAWRSLLAAEIYVGMVKASGLGQVLHIGREQLAMPQVFAVMLVIVVIGLLVDRLVFAPVERMLHRKWGTGPAKA